MPLLTLLEGTYCFASARETELNAEVGTIPFRPVGPRQVLHVSPAVVQPGMVMVLGIGLELNDFNLVGPVPLRSWEKSPLKLPDE